MAGLTSIERQRYIAEMSTGEEDQQVVHSKASWPKSTAIVVKDIEFAYTATVLNLPFFRYGVACLSPFCILISLVS
jgi:hypothetical protein